MKNTVKEKIEQTNGVLQLLGEFKATYLDEGNYAARISVYYPEEDYNFDSAFAIILEEWGIEIDEENFVVGEGDNEYVYFLKHEDKKIGNEIVYA